MKNFLPCGLLIASLVASCSFFSPIDETPEGIGVEGLRVTPFSRAEGRRVAELDDLNCNIYLRRFESDTEYLAIAGTHLDDEPEDIYDISLLKVNGDWVRFLDYPSSIEAPKPEEYWDKKISEDGELVLQLEVSAYLDGELIKASIRLSDQTEQEIYIKLRAKDEEC